MDRLLKLLLLLLSMSVQADTLISQPLLVTSQDETRYRDNHIDLLGAVTIDSATNDGKRLMEFSGLAWDEDEQLLYALSDRGYVVHLQTGFDNGKLTELRLLAYHPLRDEQGKPLVYKHADSEGLEVLNANNGHKGDTELLVSFERIPRVIRYTTNGAHLASLSLPLVLQDIRRYAGENKSLEALACLSTGLCLVGTERPLPSSGFNLFGIGTQASEAWTFYPANSDHGSLVGLTALPGGQLILLERSFPGLLAGVTNRIYLGSQAGDQLKQQELVALFPGDGLFNDNFEALTWHRGNHFFMISDDNDSFLQRSVLLYFAVMNLDQALHDIDR